MNVTSRAMGQSLRFSNVLRFTCVQLFSTVSSPFQLVLGVFTLYGKRRRQDTDVMKANPFQYQQVFQRRFKLLASTSRQSHSKYRIHRPSWSIAHNSAETTLNTQDRGLSTSFTRFSRVVRRSSAGRERNSYLTLVKTRIGAPVPYVASSR